MDRITDPAEYLDNLAGGYRAAQILLTANRLGIFSAIGSNELTCSEVAETVESDIRGIRILCDALCALNILEKSGNRYSNTDVSIRCLLPDAPEPKAAMFLHAARLYEKWGKLYDVVKRGKPVAEEDLDTRLDRGKEGFAKAMENTAGKSARLLAEKIDLKLTKNMLDIGGGPGVYSILCCQKNPNLRAKILDDSETLEVAKANVVKEDLAHRIDFLPGDMFETAFGTGYDFILISNVIHIYSAKKLQTLFQKCFNSLDVGGRLCIKDFFLDSTRTSPPWAALFAVNMLVNTDGGDCYTYDEMYKWLNDSGFSEFQSIEITPLSTAIVATR